MRSEDEIRERINILKEIENENTEFYAIWDSANTSELFKNLQIIKVDIQEDNQ